MPLKTFSDAEMLSILNNRKNLLKKLSTQSLKTAYHIMYSSLWEGFTKNPAMMNIPIDDHMVHRSDGVFETLMCANGAIFDLDSHLERLKKSSSFLGIQWPKSQTETKNICIALLKASGIEKKNAILRLFISRGPGGFTASPKESLGPVLYMIVTSFVPLPEEIYQKGAKAISSKIPVKQSPFVQMKSCNYLHNVLMKQEAETNNVNFALSFTKDSYLSEGSTENVALVNEKSELLIPSFDYTLKGTTLLRIMDLAQNLIKKKLLSNLRIAHISYSEIKKAKEMMLTGTTLGVLPLTKVDKITIGEGLPGPIAKELRHLLKEDINKNLKLRTPYL